MTGRFLLDVMLGKLAVYLRMCGHDAAYALDRDVEADDEILGWASEEGRTLLTRDEQLAGRTENSVLLCDRDVADQLRELAEAGIPLDLDERPSRCGTCNGLLERVDADAETSEYAPVPAETAVWRCRNCGQCFWKGSHWNRVEETLERV